MIRTLVRGLILFIVAAAAVAASRDLVRAEPPAWTVDDAASRLSFSGRQAGVPFEGRFERFTSDIRFDPTSPAESRIDVVIDMASAVSDNRDRDAAIRGRDWFAADEYPQARVQSATVRSLGGNRYEADATLTIRGISRPVKLPFALEPEAGATRAKGELTIVRTDYGVGQGSWSSGATVALDVIIRFDIIARRIS